MNIIVFSKDRAMQLELFIRSFNKYVKNPNNYVIKILYTYSNEFFKKGYTKLIENDYDNVKFILEKNFKDDLINLVDTKQNYTVFFVDDNVFKCEFDFYDNQMNIFENDNDILCRSLRLHPNLLRCYTMNMNMNKPTFLENNIFNWIGEQCDYGYPMSLDGHIFRTEQIFSYLIKLDYKNPNSLEGSMARYPMKYPKMICYQNSIILNNPCNKVQTNNQNLHGNIDAAFLNQKFLDNYEINLQTFHNFNNISCHQEIAFEFIKK